MNISLTLSSQERSAEEDFTPLSTPQQQSFNQRLEWRVFLRILHAICTAYGWDLEFERSADGIDASCAIFADTVCADHSADAWQLAPLLPESLE